MKQKRVWTKWFYWFTFALAVIIVYKTLDNFAEIKGWISNLLNVLMPFILGIILAYVLYTPARNIEKLFKKFDKLKFVQKRARGISVVITYIMVIIILVIVINCIVPKISESIIDFVNHFQDYYNTIVARINELPSDSVFKSETVTNAISQIGTIDISQYLNMERISQYAQGAVTFAKGIFKFFVAIIVSAYILLERREILNFLRKLASAVFDKNTCRKISMYFDRTNEIFIKFIASQLLDAIVVGILTSIALSILKVKYAVLLGVMIGVFNMIPYFGAIIAVIIATIITLITGGFSQAIWMIVITTILQQIDANIINPKIVGDSLKISPLLVVFAVTVGGAYFGVLGMFLAVPIAAILKLVICDYIEMRNTKSIKREE